MNRYVLRAGSLLFAFASLLVFGPAVGTAGAAYTSTLVGTTATFTADNNFNDLTLRTEANGNLVVHDRFDEGDVCFESNADWDCAAGVQTLANAPGSVVDVVGSPALDLFRVRLPSASPDMQAELNFDGGPGPDSEFSITLGDAAQEVTLDSGRIEGVAVQPIDYIELSNGRLLTEGGDDTVQVRTSPASPTQVGAGAGDDTVRFSDGTALGRSFEGGAGRDTLDYSSWSTPVSTELGRTGSFKALLSGDNEVPPNTSARLGFASLTFSNVTNAFTYTVQLENGFAQADVTDSHIHSGVAGVNGPVVFGIGSGAGYQVTLPGFLQRTQASVSDTDITDAALRSGSLYVNVHTTAFGDGEIRGQIELDQALGYFGLATGTVSVRAVEAVIGGDGDDTLKGTPLADRIEGGGGADTIEAGDGDDVVLGGGGEDELLGGGGDDIFDEGGVANGADLIDGGPGEDDRLDYGDRESTVTVDLSSDLEGEDGEANEEDDVRGNIEHAITGLDDDTLIGNDADNELVGGGGADSFEGRGGDDSLGAADGFADLKIDCGAGAGDVAHRDEAATDPDAIVVGCETVNPPLTTAGGGGDPPGGGPSPPEPVRPVGLLSSLKAKASGQGARIAIDTRSRASCPATATASCTLKVTATAVFPAGTLAAEAKRASLGRTTRSLAPGASAPARIKVPTGKSAAWREAGRLRVSFVVSLTVPGGDGVVRRGSASLVAPLSKEPRALPRR